MRFSLFSVLLDVLFPRSCPLCGDLRPPGSPPALGVCGICHPSLVPLAEPVCSHCGAPLISELNVCLRCRENEDPPAYDRAFSLFPYGGPARELMYQYKFRGRKTLSAYLARRITEQYGSYLKAVSLIPVPSEPRNLKKRGWDPVLTLARDLAALNGVKVERVLGRRKSISQQGLNRKDRQGNLSGKIYLRRRVEASSAVLLDDIWTTGATAQCCSLVLRNSGLKNITVLTVCRD